MVSDHAALFSLQHRINRTHNLLNSVKSSSIISFDREEDKLHIASSIFSVLNEGNLHAMYARQIVNSEPIDEWIDR